MSESEKKETPPEALAPKKAGGILALVLPAVLAGASSFGAAVLVARTTIGHVDQRPAATATKPPGATLALEPFVVNTNDANRKLHGMKVSIAVEFDSSARDDAVKAFGPRLRDAALTYFRTTSYEDASDGAHTAKMRTELLERFRTSGVASAERVLITDLVVQ